ncbi:filamentous hemagglutinin N-terminal domain-containing protein [Aerosakkonemataceae cyanobacterium BLCC-F50]|uniref:Filamentous hemagglutinin N-terminal domain-containing protein n=1 Tax=Floridaenema flaviceps BLCC-F50 TaxID=3153642 RepID=A0ABV4Y0A5_9CYAN
MATCISWNWWQQLAEVIGRKRTIAVTTYFTFASIGVTLWNSFTYLSFAQSIVDTSLGAESSVITPNVNVSGVSADRIDGGVIRGANLFHSFREFNVGNGQRVYFTNPAGIENIFTRVTGSNPSKIFGTLGVDGRANLFLLNPNGIIFGPNARLNIAGSFVASTADSVVFDNGFKFSATNPQAPPLLTINLIPGLQYGANLAGMISSSGYLTAGRNLTLAAGNLDLQGQLNAGENLTLQALDTVRVRDSVTNPFIATASGQLLIQGNRGVDVFALNHPHSGFFSGGDMVLRSDSTIRSDIHYMAGRNFQVETLNGIPGNLYSSQGQIIRANGNVTFNSYRGASLHIFAAGAVNIDSIEITQPATTNFVNETVTLSDGTTIVSINGSAQPTLDIRSGTIASGNPLAYTGNQTPNILTLSNLALGANININNIIITQPNGLVYLTNQYQPNPLFTGAIQIAKITTTNQFNNSGAVLIDARDNIRLTNGSIDTKSEVGNAGDVTLLARNRVFLSNGFRIFTTTQGSGRAGNVTIRASGAVEISGNSIEGDASAIFSDTSGSGRGGDINIEARSVALMDGAQLLTRVYSDGDGGNLRLNASEFLELSGNSARGNPSTISVGVGRETNDNTGEGSPEATGLGGKLNIFTRRLTLQDGSQILAITHGTGNAGNLTINASELVTLVGQTQNGIPSTISTQVRRGSAGNAGDLSIVTGQLVIRDGGKIDSATFGSGNSGNLSVEASESVELIGTSVDGETPSSLSTSVGRQEATGNAGTLKIDTGRLIIQHGAQVQATTFGVGDGGNLEVNATDSVEVTGTGGRRSRSILVTGVAPTAVGQGGNLQIITRSLFVTNGGRITSSTAGQGDAGNININAHNRLSLDGLSSGLGSAGIFSNVVSGAQGNGGNIRITTGELSVTDSARISSSSESSGWKAGNIQVSANSIRLNRGTLSSDTSGGQGNIELRSPSITLRQGSKITTNATGGESGGNIDVRTSSLILRQGSGVTTNGEGSANANEIKGGNITINTDVLVALENSDITANSNNSFGGQVIVNAQAIFGTQSRDEQTPESDITAKGRDSSLSGTVQINSPEIDPSSGLINLPENVVDTSRLVAKGCIAKRQETGTFYITGTGGLPTRPGDAIVSPYSTGSVRSLSSTNITNNNLTELPASESQLNDPIIEAQGAYKLENGQVVLGFPCPDSMKD